MISFVRMRGRTDIRARYATLHIHGTDFRVQTYNIEAIGGKGYFAVHDYSEVFMRILKQLDIEAKDVKLQHQGNEVVLTHIHKENLKQRRDRTVNSMLDGKLWQPAELTHGFSRNEMKLCPDISYSNGEVYFYGEYGNIPRELRTPSPVTWS